MSSGQIRSFVSIDIDDAQILSKIDSITSSLKSLGGDLRPVERENIHLTLKFLGNIGFARLDEIRNAMRGVNFQPFPIEIMGAGAFPSLKKLNIVWVGIGEGWTRVQQVFEQTEKLLYRVGFSHETRPFSPHITIARVKTGRKRDEIAAFLEHMRDESLGAFTVEHVRLKQSILSASGPAYSTLFEVGARSSA